MKTRQFDSLVNVFQVYLQEAQAHLMMVIIANLLEISTGGLFLSLKLAVFVLETLKLSKTLKSSRDDFNVLDNINVSSIKTVIKAMSDFLCDSI